MWNIYKWGLRVDGFPHHLGTEWRLRTWYQRLSLGLSSHSKLTQASQLVSAASHSCASLKRGRHKRDKRDLWVKVAVWTKWKAELHPMSTEYALVVMMAVTDNKSNKECQKRSKEPEQILTFLRAPTLNNLNQSQTIDHVPWHHEVQQHAPNQSYHRFLIVTLLSERPLTTAADWYPWYG